MPTKKAAKTSTRSKKEAPALPQPARKDPSATVWQIIVPFLVIVVVLAGIGVYLSESEEVAETQREVAVAQEKLDEQLTKLHSTVRTLEEENEQLRAEKEAEAISMRCEQLGDDWTLFEVSDAHFSFCLKTRWGVPVATETEQASEIEKGKQWTIAFPNADYLRIRYQTSDFGVSETAPVGEQRQAVTINGVVATVVMRDAKDEDSGKRVQSIQYDIPGILQGMYTLSVEGKVIGKTSDLGPVADAVRVMAESLRF